MTRLWPQGQPIEIDARGRDPKSFIWDGTYYEIDEVWNRWRIHARWWEPGQSVWREYLKVTTITGLLCLIYQELPEGSWFLARVYD
jgi:hypothetical protein